MGKINMNRVLLGGLVAGLILDISEGILNAVVLKADWEAVMKAMNKSPEMSGGVLALFNVMGFVMGISIVWLYAAIRPRYGAGPRTALCAAGFFWFAAYFVPSVFQLALDVLPAKLMGISLVWGLVEMLVAGLAGAKMYKEDSWVPGCARPR